MFVVLTESQATYLLVELSLHSWWMGGIQRCRSFILKCPERMLIRNAVGAAVVVSSKLAAWLNISDYTV